jgi:glycosyltransferase involved in cell wall biosynthesis
MSGQHEVLLVENGSGDRSYEVARGLAGEHEGVRVHAFTEPHAGLGWAYDRGMREALALGGAGRWDVLTASDLPFGFSDLEAFEQWLATSPRERIAIGSKAHPDSVLPGRGMRSVMTFVYRGARRALLGMHTGDSQGSFFVREDFAAELLPKATSRDFFYTTELVHFAERAGEMPHELPVTMAPELRASTVRPFRHGKAMFLALLALRRRTR